jgi:hypothetical protein
MREPLDSYESETAITPASTASLAEGSCTSGRGDKGGEKSGDVTHLESYLAVCQITRGSRRRVSLVCKSTAPTQKSFPLILIP